MSLSRAIVTPISFTKNGDETMLFYTQYFNSVRAERKMRELLAYSETQDCSLNLNSCSRVSYDAEHDGFSYHIDVQRPDSTATLRLYSVTFDTKEEAVEEQNEFIHTDIDTVFITDEPECYIKGSHHMYAENEAENEAEEEAESENEYDELTIPFTKQMRENYSYYVGIPVYERMLFTDEFDSFKEARAFYRNGFKEHGVDSRDIQQNHDGSTVVRFGDLSLWAFDNETSENYFFSSDLTTLIHESLYDVDVFTGVAEDVDYVPSAEELSRDEQECAEALAQMKYEIVPEDEASLGMDVDVVYEEYENVNATESESEGDGDTFMFDLSEMRLKPYGKGYLLIPDKEDDVLVGTKYFLGGWWMPNRNAWFFKEHLVQDLMDLGAKKLRKSEKDRTGLHSKKVFWKKLERGYALVPKEDYKHYGRETFRGGKWWKNGNAWFFTDNARDRYIEKYGSSSSSAKAH